MTVNIPDETYDGYEFRIVGYPTVHAMTTCEIYAESENSDPMNDAVYTRNRKVEEKLGIKIVKINSDTPSADLSKAVLANEDSYDAMVETVSVTRSNLTAGQLLGVDELPYIDISKPWWKGDVIESSAIANKQFLLFGDILYSDKNCTWALCFNKRMYDEFGLEDPYETVREGKWTLDKLAEHCSDVTKDIDGNTVLDYKDQWGLLASKTAGIGLITSSDIITANTDSSGKLQYNLDGERTISAFSKIYDIVNDNNMVLRAEDIKGVNNIWNEIINVFRDGRALYRISIMCDIANLRDMNDDFGILPMPKYDENQDKYYTTYQGWTARCYAVPVTVSDRERTSAILEYMASVSPDTITKAFYDITLQRKVARDNDSSEMLDIIFNSVTTDIGLALELGGLRNTIVGAINAGSNTISSTLASAKGAVQAEFDKVYDNIKDNT